MTFLAILELYKRGDVDLRQDGRVRRDRDHGTGSREPRWTSTRELRGDDRGAAVRDATTRCRAGQDRRARRRDGGRGHRRAEGAARTSTSREERGFQLREVAGGWKLYTHPAHHAVVEELVLSLGHAPAVAGRARGAGGHRVPAARHAAGRERRPRRELRGRHLLARGEGARARRPAATRSRATRSCTARRARSSRSSA